MKAGAARIVVFAWLATAVFSGCASFSGEQSARDPQGKPITLDTVDPRFTPYLTLVHDKIRSNWRYPCVTNAATGRYDYSSASLVVEIGILQDGRVQYVDVRESSGSALYDDAAVQAVKAASPFPEVPAAMMATRKEGRPGVPILARFKYVVETPPAR